MRERLGGCPDDWRRAMDAVLPDDSVIGSRDSDIKSTLDDAEEFHEKIQLAWSVLLALTIAALGAAAISMLADLPSDIKSTLR